MTEMDILANECKIDLYSEGKATESVFEIEEVDWSEYENRSPKEILGE